MEALNLTMNHDDGQLGEDYDQADVVPVGISRTSKTPTSIYLANRGIKTANIPIVLGVPLPDSLLKATNPLIVGLIAPAALISSLRAGRRTARFPTSGRTLYPGPAPRTLPKVDFA